MVAIFFGISQLRKNDNQQFNLQNVNSLSVDDKKQALEDQLKKYQDDAAALAADVGDSTKTTTYARLADIQIRLERYDDAIATLDKIPEGRKSNSTVQALYARAYAGLGQNDKAKQAINIALASEDDVPEYWLVYFNLNQDMDSAKLNTQYYSALAKTDNNIDLIKHFARSLESRGDKPGAISLWQKAIEKDPEHAADYDAEITRLKS